LQRFVGIPSGGPKDAVAYTDRPRSRVQNDDDFNGTFDRSDIPRLAANWPREVENWREMTRDDERQMCRSTPLLTAKVLVHTFLAADS
jgi:hypothetical protein